MAFGTSNRAAVRAVKETVFGQTPASPTLKPIRYTGESLNFNIENVTSAEIRSDRMIDSLIQTGADASGDVEFELSYESFDDYLESALASTYQTAVAIAAATDISAANADNSYNSTTTNFTTENMTVGQWIKVEGFTEAANNGYVKLVSIAANKIVVAGATLADEASGDSINMDGTMLRNGTTLSSFTVQKHLQDLATPLFINYTGARVGALNLNFQANQILTGSISLMALAAATSTSQFGSATIDPATTTEAMNAVGNITSIWIDDAASSAYFSDMSLNLDNSLRPQDAIGTLGHVGVALGTLQLSGNINIYFEDSTMYDKYLNGTAFSIAMAVQDTAGNAYIITLPKVKFETGEVVSGGLDTDIMLNATWRAIKDATTSCMIQIDKIAA